eukprot:1148036-Pyramimonas_sp.AAC.1
MLAHRSPPTRDHGLQTETIEGRYQGRYSGLAVKGLIVARILAMITRLFARIEKMALHVQPTNRSPGRGSARVN